MKHMIFIVIFSVALLMIGFVWMMVDLKKESTTVHATMLPLALLEVGTRQIPVELAMDDASRARGLSYRESLDADRGMYFIFATSSVQYFWMHQMKFPLDIVFINGNEVVSIFANVPNPSGLRPPAIVHSRVPADRVLELNAGKAAEWGITEGTKLIDPSLP